ncbi:hypothetical protein [Halalkalibacillus halophilus]|uniref:hypothetical protein n=1 Tax=Halalkalibacillus halophilus TaxID=392827 RepID=UPI0003FAB3E8|nr:hypothetical protein [Halalkalibacillus halophilus]
MWEITSNNEDLFIMFYCLLILWVNVSYLREHKEIKKGLSELSDEDELELNPNSFSMMVIGLVFNFFRRWLLYILAVLMTESVVVLIISLLLFVVSLYDTLFNYSLAKVKTSKIGLYLAIADVVFILAFLVYLFI